MSGHLRQRSPGSWEVRYRAHGKTITRTVKGGKREAEKALRAALSAVDRGEHVAAKKLTVGAFVAERIGVWDVTERTRENYRTIAKMLAPLAGLQLQRLTTLAIEQWHSDLRARGLAPSTIRAAHRMLVRVLADAVHHKLAIANIAREQPPPRAPVRKVKVPNESALPQMLARLRGDAFYVPAVLTLYAGLRRGELWRCDGPMSALTTDAAGRARARGNGRAGITFKGPRPRAACVRSRCPLQRSRRCASTGGNRRKCASRWAWEGHRRAICCSAAWMMPAAVAERIQRDLDTDCEASRSACRHVARAAALKREPAAASWRGSGDDRQAARPQPARHDGAAVPAQHHRERSSCRRRAGKGARVAFW